jgi:hypothetical protein
MQLPQSVIRELAERLVTFDPPPFGKVRVEIEMNYAEAALKGFHLCAYPVETFKA